MNPPAASPTFAMLTFVLIAGCTLSKLAAASLTGFTGDEAYTIVIARTLALSYFDHPPLHQWIVYAFTACFGEGWWVRLPFLFMAVALNVPLYGLTRRLFGHEAALCALFGFNATAYFVVWPDGLILPDVPLFLFLTAGVWAVAEILFAPPRKNGTLWLLWLAAGMAFGFAGLSKYSAIFVPVSLFGFLCGSNAHRQWLWRPHAYVAAALAIAIFSPVLIWNYQNDWVSFAFQSGRAAQSASLDASAFAAFGKAVGAQAALLSPWAGIPLLIALASATRTPGAGSASRFLLWLVAVPLVLFSALPFFGKTAIPHWFNSAWLFAFPLLGRWLSEQNERRLRSWAVLSAVLTAVSFAAFTGYVAEGPFFQVTSANASQHEPTQWSYDWQLLRDLSASSASDAVPPAFVVADNWRVGGKAGAALGPQVPVCVFSQDPREFAYLCDTNARLGQDALIIIPKERAELGLAALAPYFQRLGPTEEIAVGRRGHSERLVTLTRAYVLLRPYPSPYGNDSKQMLAR